MRPKIPLIDRACSQLSKMPLQSIIGAPHKKIRPKCISWCFELVLELEMVVVGVAFLKALNPWCDSYKKGPEEKRETRNERRLLFRSKVQKTSKRQR